MNTRNRSCAVLLPPAGRGDGRTPAHRPTDRPSNTRNRSCTVLLASEGSLVEGSLVEGSLVGGSRWWRCREEAGQGDGEASGGES
jgi:hypothetical protein